VYFLRQEAATTSDWGKMRFVQYPRKSWEEILPGLQPQERDLVSKLIVYESGDRLSAEEVCLTVAVYVFPFDADFYRRCCNTAISKIDSVQGLVGPNKKRIEQVLDNDSSIRLSQSVNTHTDLFDVLFMTLGFLFIT
jgi:hypothetical protein